MLVRLRKTQPDDINFVLNAENSEENRHFVFLWSEDQHRFALKDKNMAHFIVEASTDHRCVGYIILAGLSVPNLNIELKRIVITEKSKGFGRSAIKIVKHYAFEQLHTHRLWLDVIERNNRAKSLYESEGFYVEGVLRECLKTTDGYQSLILMSILEQEYRTNLSCCSW